MKRIQSHPGSYFLRHQAATQYIIETLRPLGKEARILSFGASWGAEVIPFALSLPEANIVAAEIEPNALAHSRALFDKFDNVEVVKSNWEDIAARGPYQAICCNSVLCKYPAARDIDDLSDVFPFSEFEDVYEQLDAKLTPGGVMMIFNTNYSPRDTEISNQYVPYYIPSKKNVIENFVCHFNREGIKLVQNGINGPIIRIDLPDYVSTNTHADRAFLIRRMNEGLFIKRPSLEQRAALSDAEAMFDATPSDFSADIRIDLNAAYRISIPPKEGYRNIPIVQHIGLKPNSNEYQVSHWWGDQLLAIPS